MSDVNPRYRRVLFPLDGSRLAEGIIPCILDTAGPLDMEVVLLRVVSPAIAQMAKRPRRSSSTTWRRE